MLKGKHRAVSGIVCVLHSYGKELILNSHVHVLLTEGGLTKAGEWVCVSFLSYWCCLLVLFCFFVGIDSGVVLGANIW